MYVYTHLVYVHIHTQTHELDLSVQNVKVTVAIDPILEIVSLIESYIEDVEEFLIVPPTKEVRLSPRVCHLCICTHIHTHINAHIHRK